MFMYDSYGSSEVYWRIKISKNNKVRLELLVLPLQKFKFEFMYSNQLKINRTWQYGRSAKWACPSTHSHVKLVLSLNIVIHQNKLSRIYQYHEIIMFYGGRSLYV